MCDEPDIIQDSADYLTCEEYKNLVKKNQEVLRNPRAHHFVNSTTELIFPSLETPSLTGIAIIQGELLLHIG